MKIIEPKVELWRQEDAKAHVARCARVCYGKETGNDIANHFNNEPIFDEWIVENEEHKKVYLYYDACESSFNKYHILILNVKDNG